MNGERPSLELITGDEIDQIRTDSDPIVDLAEINDRLTKEDERARTVLEKLFNQENE